MSLGPFKQTDFPYDAIVMLTWSDWYTEPRSNRYHYARRFSELGNVYFVQPDGLPEGYQIEGTEFERISVVHVPRDYDSNQREALGQMLSEQGVRRPLYWVYNPSFIQYLDTAYTPCIIYHATEDLLSDGFYGRVSDPSKDEGVQRIRRNLKRLLAIVDGVVAVTAGVLGSILTSGYKGDSLVLRNGVDEAFWSTESPNLSKEANRDRPLVVYQGGVNWRLDFLLLIEVAKLLPQVDFELIGKIEVPEPSELRKLRTLPNVKICGARDLSEVRERCQAADVGIIPFQQLEIICEKSLPLKAFEYVASGLPVVSVPIDELEAFGSLFAFAADAETFASEILSAINETHTPERIEEWKQISRSMDYDKRFADLQGWMTNLEVNVKPPGFNGSKLRVLVVYDHNSIHVTALKEHVESFGIYSKHLVFYVSGTKRPEAYGRGGLPEEFDVIVIHYSVRLSIPDHLSEEMGRSIARSPVLKIAFIQDEYDTTETTRSWLEKLGVNIVYTCVPAESVSKVYPEERFKGVGFIQNLTGYVSENLLNVESLPLAARSNAIVYRGRELPVWYGVLGDEKLEIGRRMRKECEIRHLPCDIEWDDGRRIYGEDWMVFLGSGRATLGTESGSNVFDFSGSIRANVEAKLRKDSKVPRDQLYDEFVSQFEGKVEMNQVSPKIFEAIACRTALCLFEGHYSGVVEPHKHFIEIKKDFSNLDEVFQKLCDDKYLEELTDRAYADVIQSGNYSYQNFILEFDALIEKCMRTRCFSRNAFRIETSLQYGNASGIDVTIGGLDFQSLSLDQDSPVPRSLAGRAYSALRRHGFKRFLTLVYQLILTRLRNR